MDVTGLTINNSANKFSVGRAGDYDGYCSNGWIDEFHFSKGVARWKAVFTPPTQAYYSDDYVPTTPTAIPKAGWVEKQYAYAGTQIGATPYPQPHALTALDVTDCQTFENTYEHDANGNLLNDSANTYAYDSANRLTSVNGTGSYTYNGSGDQGYRI